MLTRLQREVISGLSLIQAQGIRVYREAATPDTDRNICEYVTRVIVQMPITFKIPMMGIICLIGLSALVSVGRVRVISEPEGRAALVRLKWIPGYAIVVKFVRATVYLKLFDEIKL